MLCCCVFHVTFSTNAGTCRALFDDRRDEVPDELVIKNLLLVSTGKEIGIRSHRFPLLFRILVGSGIRVRAGRCLQLLADNGTDLSRRFMLSKMFRRLGWSTHFCTYLHRPATILFPSSVTRIA